MGKKKQSASNKLAKMSDEDRARYLQHRADIEEEARRRKQELIGTYLKTKFKHEEAFMRINLAKINQEWRQILRKITCKELKSELEATRAGVDEVLQRKQEIINCLLKELDESEDQYNRSFQTHLMNIEKMMSVYVEQLNEMNRSFESEKDDMIYKAIRNKMNIETDHDQQINHLKTILFQVETENNADVKERQEARLGWRQEFESDEVVQYDMMVVKEESMIGTLWQEINKTISEYLTKTEIKRKDYADLKQSDNEESACIDEYYLTIIKLTETIEQLCDELREMQEGNTNKITCLTFRKSGLLKKLASAKKASNSLLELDQSQLVKMTLISNAVMENLKNVFKQGEHILQAAMVCRKLETERDKVDPWSGFEDDVTGPYKEYINKMEKFWWRYNLVLTECDTLRTVNQKLEEENKKLKAEVQEYFSEVVLEGPTRTLDLSAELLPQLHVSTIKKKQSIAVLRCK